MANGKDFSNVKQFNGQSQAPQRRDTASALVELLSKNMRAIKSALPKHLTGERVARVALNSIRHTPKLMQCAPETLCMAIMEASSLGLEIDMRGQAYLVPFWNSKTRTNDVQLIIGYKGLLDLAWRSGNIMSIMAEVVGENDKFNVVFGLEPKLEHVPNFTEGRGEIIAAYAVAIMKDGSKQFVVIPRTDLEKVRAASKSADSGPWVQWTEEMYKKTALKRLCKLLPLSPEIQRAATVDDQADAGIAQSFAETIIDIPSPQPIPVQDHESIQPEEPEAPVPEAEIVEPEVKPEPITPRNGNGKKQAQASGQQKNLQDVQEIDNSYIFRCPSSGKNVSELFCRGCRDRKGCPAFEAM